MSYAVFVNYRVGDQDTTAALIASILRERFGRDRVFQASTSIPPSRPFPEAILAAIRGAAVVLAVIGERWLMADDTGRPRVHAESDWVRREFAEALAAGVTILPVLVGPTRPLRPADLPEDIRVIASLQYLRLHYRSVDPDVSNLVREVIALAPALQAASTDPPPVDPAAIGHGFGILWTRMNELLASGPDRVGDLLGDLIRLRDALRPYRDDPGLIEPNDGSLRSRLARLRVAIEEVLGQPLPLPGEPAGTDIIVNNTTGVLGAGGRNTDVRLRNTEGVRRVEVVKHTDTLNGTDAAVIIGFPEDPA